jgi:prepilin-type N-terminal cleavage/methylation domain-containing protein
MVRSSKGLDRLYRAFTLVEILCCLVIVAALTAIVASVFRSSLARGKLSSETEQLHQIALAATLYHEQCDGWPTNTGTLVRSGLIPKAVCYSPRDKYPIGWANRFLTGVSLQEPAYAKMLSDFPNTYLSLFDLRSRPDKVDPILNGQNGVGLFVSLVESENMFPKDSATGPFKGTYRRALLDGSVQKRTHMVLEGPDAKGKPIRAMSEITWFFDPDEKWKNEFLTSF